MAATTHPERTAPKGFRAGRAAVVLASRADVEKPRAAAAREAAATMGLILTFLSYGLSAVGLTSFAVGDSLSVASLVNAVSREQGVLYTRQEGKKSFSSVRFGGKNREERGIVVCGGRR